MKRVFRSHSGVDGGAVLRLWAGFGVGVRFLRWRSASMPGCTGSALAVWFIAGLLLFRSSQVISWLISLSLLATVRGGTSFLI